MNTETFDVSEALNAKAEAATIEMMRKGRDALRSQVAELVTIVREIPNMLTEARLNAKEGKETKYDYERARRACRVNP
jgi:hypothetical protein